MSVINYPTSKICIYGIVVILGLCGTYVVHHCNGTELPCAPSACIVHHQRVLCNMVHKGDLRSKGVTHNIVWWFAANILRWCRRARTQSIVHSFSKETQHLGSCLSFGEEYIPVDLGLYIILENLYADFPWSRVTWPWPWAPGKIHEEKFLLRLSVHVWNNPLCDACWWESYGLNKQISLGSINYIPLPITIMCPTYAISMIRGQFHTGYSTLIWLA